MFAQRSTPPPPRQKNRARTVLRNRRRNGPKMDGHFLRNDPRVVQGKWAVAVHRLGGVGASFPRLNSFPPLKPPRSRLSRRLLLSRSIDQRLDTP